MAKAPIPESEIDKGGTAKDTRRLQAVHERGMKRFDEVAVPQIPERARMLEARRFTVIPGAMWEGPFGELFENSPRPEIDLITKNMEKIEEDYRQNQVMVSFLPRGDADEDSADLLNGMYRADFTHFACQEAVRNAFKEALGGGMGAWRMSTDYADPRDPDRDEQRIIPAIKIVDADQSVYLWGGIRDDGADAKAGFIITADLRSVAEEEWGADSLSDWPLARGAWRWQYEWYRPDLVYKAEYYEIEEVPDEVLIFTQAQSGEEQRYFASEIENGVSGDLKAQGWTLKKRPWKRVRVHKYIMNGTKVLKDCGYIVGCDIPIVIVYGRVDWVDGQPRYRGYAQKKMDPQRLLNTRVAKLAETDALAPYEVPIVADEQMTPDIAQEWARGNIDRHPFRRLLPLRNQQGDIVSAGPIGTISPPEVPAVTAALLQFSVQMLTDDDDQTDQVQANTSADALDMAQARVDAKSGIWLDNNATAHQRAGEIYKNMAPEIYYEPGRMVDTMSVDGQFGTSELSEPVLDDRNVYRLRHDLSKGNFGVVSSVAEATATKKQKVVRQDLAISSAAVAAQNMDLASATLLHAVYNLDGEGTEELQQYARQKLVALGVVKPTPEEQQEIEQAQQQKSQQPDPQALALQSQIQKVGAEATKAQAGAQQLQAKARLENAQADVLEKAPKVPQGLNPAPESPNPVEQVSDIADAHSKMATANLNNTKADHLRQMMTHQHIQTGAELHQQGHQQEMDRRAADLAEKQASQSQQDNAA